MANEQSNVQEQNVEMEQEQAQEVSEPKAIHHATKKGADMSLAKCEISQESHRAVLKGELSLQEARDLGRNNGPGGPVGQSTAKATRKTTEPTLTPCLCGCGELVARYYKSGHDARLPGLVLRAVRGEIELTEEQREHAEKRDLFAEAKAKIAAQKAKDEARAAKKRRQEK